MAIPLRFEVVYALPEQQTLLDAVVTEGSTVVEGICASGILTLHPEIDLQQNRVGIFGHVVALDRVLADGDRIEIYRPLLADPKESRRTRAQKAKNLR